MAIYQFEDRVPQIGRDVYIHPSAEVIGKVTIGDGCWVGPGARLRGDYGEIVVGERSSIEDNCVIHARPGDITRIGNHVTIGHGAVIHNATVHDYAVVGMGAVVKQHQEIPAGHIAVGVPARVMGQVTPEYKEQWPHFKDTYTDLAKRYPKGLKETDQPV